jgi:hypothetical protein
VPVTNATVVSSFWLLRRPFPLSWHYLLAFDEEYKHSKPEGVACAADDASAHWDRSKIFQI